jgi:hypothetical protein
MIALLKLALDSVSNDFAALFKMFFLVTSCALRLVKTNMLAMRKKINFFMV